MDSRESVKSQKFSELDIGGHETCSGTLGVGIGTMRHIKQFSIKLFSGICVRFGNTGMEKVISGRLFGFKKSNIPGKASD